MADEFPDRWIDIAQIKCHYIYGKLRAGDNMLTFEWDIEKAKSNEEKHGITFDEASTVFSDPLSLTIHDPLHSENEARFAIIGTSHKNRILIVIHTERGDNIRIISVRKATKNERLYYESND